MRWPWKRHTATPDLEKACEDLRRVKEQRPEVDRLAGDLERHRHMNGFADLVFRGRERR